MNWDMSCFWDMGTDRSLPIVDDLARTQIQTLRHNAEEFGVTLYDIDSPHQGIVHVMGPERGLTQPGMTIVCGDSHTSTHGAFGALAFGIGTSQVEHVLATQCLPMSRPKSMEIRVNGDLPAGVTAKDLILAIIGQIGVDGGTGHVIEYTGEAVRALSMEARMTVCNMSIEAGAPAQCRSSSGATPLVGMRFHDLGLVCHAPLVVLNDCGASDVLWRPGAHR